MIEENSQRELGERNDKKVGYSGCGGVRRGRKRRRVA